MISFLKIKKSKNKITTLIEAVQQIEKLEQELNLLAERIKNLETETNLYFQKFYLIRYNSVETMGGDQSFSLALLDKEDDGFILSSLFIDERARVFIKPIKKGVSQYQLSDEEQQALKKALAK
ncbi:MAG TPA: DUF4446 family protein [Candidatus Pacearchaeota archaeon]|nr:DUF4446 family protein [Candidatus Pacearchaeota archaeon]